MLLLLLILLLLLLLLLLFCYCCCFVIVVVHVFLFAMVIGKISDVDNILAVENKFADVNVSVVDLAEYIVPVVDVFVVFYCYCFLMLLYIANYI